MFKLDVAEVNGDAFASLAEECVLAADRGRVVLWVARREELASRIGATAVEVIHTVRTPASTLTDERELRCQHINQLTYFLTFLLTC